MRRARQLAFALLWVVTALGGLALMATVILEAYFEVDLLGAIGTLVGADASGAAFRFARPWALLLLLGAPLAWLAQYLFRTRFAPRLRFSRGRDLSEWHARGPKAFFRDAPAAFRAGTLFFVALALAAPESLRAKDKTEVEGIDMVLVLDLSLSMQAADIRPNRFDATKYVVDDFLSRRPNDRIGAVVFGRDAYTLAPLTTDKTVLRNAVAELQLGLIDGRGTAIGNGVSVGLNRLRKSTAKSRALILLTDGDSNSGNISPSQAAEFAKAMKVKIYAVLMGETDKTRKQSGADQFGRPIFDTGTFPVNPELLGEIATQTGGKFFSVRDREALERSFHAILDQLEKSEIEDVGRTYADVHPAFLWPAAAALLIELLLRAFLLRRLP